MTDFYLLYSNITTPGQLQQHAWSIIEPFGHIASLRPFFAKLRDLPKAVEEELTLAMKIADKLTVDLAHADDSDESGDIAEPSAPNMDMPAPIVSATNMDMPAPNHKPLGNPSKIPNTAVSKTNNMNSNQTQAIEPQQEPEPMNMSGKWSTMFNDSTDRSLVLNLWSASGNIIMGYGTLIEAGSGNSVTSSGSANAQELTLTAKLPDSDYTKQKNTEYDLDLFMINSTLSGTYVLKSAGQFLGKGNATAVEG